MDKLKVLFLGARPREAPPLRVKEQVLETERSLVRSGLRDRIDLQAEYCVTFDDLPEFVIERAPAVVHITMHSTSSGSVALEDNAGSVFLLEPLAFVKKFSVKAMHRSIRCLVLGTSHSDQIAEELSSYIDFVIGSRDEITQNAAIAFAKSFYPALARGESVQVAFDLAQSHFHGVVGSLDLSLPKLYVRKGADASQSLCPSQHRRELGVQTEQVVSRPADRQPVAVFIHHLPNTKSDRALFKELSVYLSPLQQQGLIKCWDVTQVDRGQMLEEVTLRRFREAMVVLLLISPNAVANKAWLSLADLAMERQTVETLRVMPILLRPTQTDGMKFSALAGIPSDGRAVVAFQDHSIAWNEVAAAVKNVASEP